MADDCSRECLPWAFQQYSSQSSPLILYVLGCFDVHVLVCETLELEYVFYFIDARMKDIRANLKDFNFHPCATVAA